MSGIVRSLPATGHGRHAGTGAAGPRIAHRIVACAAPCNGSNGHTDTSNRRSGPTSSTESAAAATSSARTPCHTNTHAPARSGRSGRSGRSSASRSTHEAASPASRARSCAANAAGRSAGTSACVRRVDSASRSITSSRGHATDSDRARSSNSGGTEKTAGSPDAVARKGGCDDRAPRRRSDHRTPRAAPAPPAAMAVAIGNQWSEPNPSDARMDDRPRADVSGGGDRGVRRDRG